MSPEQTQQFADSLLSTAEKLQNRMERVARLPIIHPKDVMDQVGPIVGELHGTARAIEWWAMHGGQEGQP